MFPEFSCFLVFFGFSQLDGWLGGFGWVPEYAFFSRPFGAPIHKLGHYMIYGFFLKIRCKAMVQLIQNDRFISQLEVTKQPFKGSRELTTPSQKGHNRRIAMVNLFFFLVVEADVSAYEELLPLGLFSGVTTNPATLGLGSWVTLNNRQDKGQRGYVSFLWKIRHHILIIALDFVL